MKSITQAYLHPSVCDPAVVEALQDRIGCVAVQSNRGRGVILIRREDYAIREALKGVDFDDNFTIGGEK